MTPIEIATFLIILFILKCGFDAGMNRANPGLIVNLVFALAAAVLLVFVVV